MEGGGVGGGRGEGGGVRPVFVPGEGRAVVLGGAGALGEGENETAPVPAGTTHLKTSHWPRDRIPQQNTRPSSTGKEIYTQSTLHNQPDFLMGRCKL